MVNYLLEKSQVKFFEFENEKNSIFKIINFNTNNSSNNINTNFDAFYNNSNNINNVNVSSTETFDLTFIKTNIYSFIYKSIGNAQKIKDANFKSFTNEIMNFLEAIILKHNVKFL